MCKSDDETTEWAKILSKVTAAAAANEQEMKGDTSLPTNRLVRSASEDPVGLEDKKSKWTFGKRKTESKMKVEEPISIPIDVPAPVPVSAPLSKNELASLKEQVQQSKLQMNAPVPETTRLRHEIATLKEQFQQSKRQLNVPVSEIALLKNEIATLKEQVQQNKLQINELENKLEHQEKLIQELKAVKPTESIGVQVHLESHHKTRLKEKTHKHSNSESAASVVASQHDMMQTINNAVEKMKEELKQQLQTQMEQKLQQQSKLVQQLQQQLTQLETRKPPQVQLVTQTKQEQDRNFFTLRRTDVMTTHRPRVSQMAELFERKLSSEVQTPTSQPERTLDTHKAHHTSQSEKNSETNKVNDAQKVHPSQSERTLGHHK